MIDGVRRYTEEFKQTDYFQFYNSLLNDPELNICAERNGYKIFFMPHPNIMSCIGRFTKSPNVEFGSLATKYRDVFAKSSLVVTDYSSTVFDFAYLRKPVVYCHFDKKKFFSSHTYTEGYFDYERDGFGEVEYTLKGTVDRIIEYMEKDCILKEKYSKRISDFFAFNDRNNCKRVYDVIRNHKN